MKKELRDEIKQDEFATGLEKAIAWANQNAQQLRIGIGAAVVLLAVIGGIVWYRAQRASESEAALQEALQTYEAPLASEIPPGADRPAGRPVFASAEEKYKAAVAAFDGVAQRFGNSEPGLRARYFAAVSRIELKQYDEAEKGLREVQSRGSGIEAELSRAALADLYRRSGQVDKAVEAYKGLATNPTANLPRDYALVTAARTLEDAKRWSEARATYKQLYEEFPASVFAGEARSRAEYLDTAVQG